MSTPTNPGYDSNDPIQDNGSNKPTDWDAQQSPAQDLDMNNYSYATIWQYGTDSAAPDWEIQNTGATKPAPIGNGQNLFFASGSFYGVSTFAFASNGQPAPAAPSLITPLRFIPAGVATAIGNSAISAFEGVAPGTFGTYAGTIFYIPVTGAGAQFGIRLTKIITVATAPASADFMTPGTYEVSYSIGANPAIAGGKALQTISAGLTLQLVAFDTGQIVDITPAGGIASSNSTDSGSFSINSLTVFGRSCPFSPQLTFVNFNVTALANLGGEIAGVIFSNFSGIKTG